MDMYIIYFVAGFILDAAAWVTTATPAHSSLTTSTIARYGPGTIMTTPEIISGIEVEEHSRVNAKRCHADCNPACTSEWTGPNNYKRNVLEFSSISRHQAGQYRCTVKNSVGTKSKSFPVSVLYGPGVDVTGSVNSTSIELREHSRVNSIGCTADCNPPCTSQWTGPDNYNRGVLEFSSISRHQAGQYRCIVKNSVGTSRRSLYVSVLYGPGDISMTPSYNNITIRQGAWLSRRSCNADCNPVCTSRWYGPGIRGRRTSLYLGAAKKNHAGHYTCTVYNTYGNKSLDIYVNVLYGPRQLDISPRSHYFEQEGFLVPNITCSADCNPECNLYWRKNGRIFRNEADLSLGRLDSSTDGTYTCQARNYSLSANFNVNTYYGPKNIHIDSEQTNLLFNEGDLVPRIKCTAICSPQCDIYWTGPNGYTTKKYYRRNQNLMDIGTAQKTDIGVYECIASNQYGSQTKSVTIDVNYGASAIRFDPPRLQYILEEGSPIEPIKCTTSCKPQCIIQWYHGMVLVSDTEQLSLVTTDRSKDGIYTCVATNDLGSTSKSITVSSLFPPKLLEKKPVTSAFTVTNGDNVTIKIGFEASPSLHTELLFAAKYGNTTHLATPNYDILQKTSDPCLFYFWFSVFFMNEKDDGLYILNISNSLGFYQHGFSISLRSEESRAFFVTPWMISAIVEIVLVVAGIVLVFLVRKKRAKGAKSKT